MSPFSVFPTDAVSAVDVRYYGSTLRFKLVTIMGIVAIWPSWFILASIHNPLSLSLFTHKAQECFPMVIILTAKRRLEMKAHSLLRNLLRIAEQSHMRRAFEMFWRGSEEVVV
jgi:hypothetical protein